MTDNNFLPSLMSQWLHDSITASPDFDNQIHLGDEECYLLSLPDALNKAPEEDVNHLSSCPICLQKWTNWLKAVTLSEGNEAEDDLLISYGLLEAASGQKKVEGIALKSVCNNFKLSLFPQQNDMDCALITVEYLSDNYSSVEGRHFMVRDGNGKIITDGQFRHGRFARTTKQFQQINLDRWTIIENKCQSKKLIK